MSVLNQEEFLKRIQSLVGEDTSEESITALEDFTDTYNSLTSNASENWEQKYHENDEAWRKKYKERFFTPSESNTPSTIPNTFTPQQNEPEKEITFDDLFK
jgi:hypothetical protein